MTISKKDKLDNEIYIVENKIEELFIGIKRHRHLSDYISLDAENYYNVCVEESKQRVELIGLLQKRLGILVSEKMFLKINSDK